ncbi:hypothetical protein SPRG_20098 [Saprolegnia parasitica CBS 223.65]|uniref:Uncharacterized protein n=1 Tax=Saprolegnia parasitica (strain CBS 223.65) TaxID=695850 RepID=A0A067CDZ9_SAPPC|nr:hypothetical protein SPRG_20098 [Saprolegnia parasitica CBS 223.65]KDO28994.1 hypothetical protein SPRG_20098 [Saprolegnia parasitica CBS 223.65]|eukprot:XP_012200324.1 hypothetical protein SPRG_20098 [Saprolegnia parasitica CBS 223.65]
MLVDVGFWCKDEADPLDGRPHPRTLQDAAWFSENVGLAAIVVDYLRTQGCVESYEMGYSFCRLGDACPPKSMGACTMTDGVYCWPEGYAHYLDIHCVRPPQELVDHILAQPRMPRPSRLYLWDHATLERVPMPLAMQSMVLANTTLTLPESSSSSCVVS